MAPSLATIAKALWEHLQQHDQESQELLRQRYYKGDEDVFIRWHEAEQALKLHIEEHSQGGGLKREDDYELTIKRTYSSS